jgi:sugar phosphate isomerase/epimerase
MTRRTVLQGGVLAAQAPARPRKSKMEIGFHTGAFNRSYWNFDQCLAWAEKNNVRHIECGVVGGVTWLHGLGYHPHIALWEDPVAIRKKTERYGVELSQIDAAFPLSKPEGASVGLEYVINSIRWAKLAGCPRVDTTDDRMRPEGMTDREGMEHLRRIYLQIVRVAEAHGIVVNIEPHGYFTTNPDFLAQMLAFADSPFLRINLDTGNVFIAGRDPVAFMKQFLAKVDHVHVKDVSPSLAAAARGKQTGIAMSDSAIGDGVNADNIRKCLDLLAGAGYNGVLSMETESQGGPMLEKSLRWLRVETARASSGV